MSEGSGPKKFVRPAILDRFVAPERGKGNHRASWFSFFWRPVARFFPQRKRRARPSTAGSPPSGRPPGGRPPGLPPIPERPQRQLTRQELLYRNVLAFVAIVVGVFILNVFFLGGLQHVVSQQKLGNEFREQLASATAPTSEGDSDLVLLADGAPVAYLEIPQLGVHEYVVEGTDAASLAMGPGHRRDTVLPGQAGTSVIMGRAAAYGGVFSGVQSLQPGEKFSVVTGQGYHVYQVIGLRYAGDPGPAEPGPDTSRLVLEVARGMPYLPTGVARIDAQMISTSPVYPGSVTPGGSQDCPTSPATSSPTTSSTSSPTSTPKSSLTPSPTTSTMATKTPATNSARPSPCPTVGTATPRPTGSLTPASGPSSTPTVVPTPTPTTGAQAAPQPVRSPVFDTSEVSGLSGSSESVAQGISVGGGDLQAEGTSSTPSPTNSQAVISTPTSSPTTSSTAPPTSNVTKVATGGSAKAFPAGARYTSANTLPLEHREMATDMSTLWALIFGLQALLALEIAAIWSYRKFGSRKTWIVALPVVGLTAIFVSDQLIRLLPNLT